MFLRSTWTLNGTSRCTGSLKEDKSVIYEMKFRWQAYSTRSWLASSQNVLTCPLIRLNSMKYICRVFHIESYPWRCHAPTRNCRRRRWGDQCYWRAVEEPQIACTWGMESHHITENPKKLMNKQKKPGGHWTQFYAREPWLRSPTALYHFWQESVRVLLSFCMPFIDQWYLFHIPCSECCISFQLRCMCTVF